MNSEFPHFHDPSLLISSESTTRGESQHTDSTHLEHSIEQVPSDLNSVIAELRARDIRHSTTGAELRSRDITHFVTEPSPDDLDVEHPSINPEGVPGRNRSNNTYDSYKNLYKTSLESLKQKCSKAADFLVTTPIIPGQESMKNVLQNINNAMVNSLKEKKITIEDLPVIRDIALRTHALKIALHLLELPIDTEEEYRINIEASKSIFFYTTNLIDHLDWSTEPKFAACFELIESSRVLVASPDKKLKDQIETASKLIDLTISLTEARSNHDTRAIKSFTEEIKQIEVRADFLIRRMVADSFMPFYIRTATLQKKSPEEMKLMQSFIYDALRACDLAAYHRDSGHLTAAKQFEITAHSYIHVIAAKIRGASHTELMTFKKQADKNAKKASEVESALTDSISSSAGGGPAI
jgi:hypothetical protein